MKLGAIESRQGRRALTVYSSTPTDLVQVLDYAAMGCDNIIYLHLGFPKYQRPSLCLLKDLHLPALKNLSLAAYMTFDLKGISILDDLRSFSKFCATHEISCVRFRICRSWRWFDPECDGSLIDAINQVCIEGNPGRIPSRHPTFGTKTEQQYSPIDGYSEWFYNDSISTRQSDSHKQEVVANTASSDIQEHSVEVISNKTDKSQNFHELNNTKFRYVARELRLAVGFLERHIYNLADILFSMDPVRVAPQKRSKRWGTELFRICLDKVYIDQIIWNLDHVNSLSKLRIFAVNKVSHSKASCIGHVDASWSLSYDSHLCKESTPKRYGDSSLSACPAKRRVLKSMAEVLVQQCAKELPSLQMVYLDSERFWIEREDGEIRKVWRLWNAMDHPVQRARIDREISLEDWAFLSCQDVDDTVIFQREEINCKAVN